MASKYKKIGPITSVMETRDFKRWILVFEDGYEISFGRKKYMLLMFRSILPDCENVRCFEETVMRTKTINDHDVKEDSFRIDITERIRMELFYESLSSFQIGKKE